LDAARAAMAAAIRVVTVERGHDPRDFALVAFGGAGPMHACALAGELGITRVLIPPAAGVLSALGLLAAPLTADASKTQLMRDPSPADIERALAPLIDEVERGLRAQGAGPARVVCAVDCRYAGQAHEVTVEAGPAVFERFAAEHRARFGWDAPGEPVETVTFRARALGPDPIIELPTAGRAERIDGPLIIPRDDSTVVIDEAWTGERTENGTILLWMR
jgi:N-methylhydantoinase A